MLHALSHLRPHSRLRVARLRDAITQTIHHTPKLRLLTDAFERTGKELGRVQGALAGLRQLSVGLAEHPGREAGAELQSRGNLALATTFALADLAIQGVICQANFGRFGLLAVIVATIGITVGLTAVGFGVVHSLANDARPEQSIKHGKWLSLAMTLVVIVSGLMVAYLRFAGADTSDQIFEQGATAWWVLAEMLPAAAGAWLAVAYQRSYPQIVEREIRAHEEYRSELDTFLAWLISTRTRLELGNRASAPVGPAGTAGNPDPMNTANTAAPAPSVNTTSDRQQPLESQESQEPEQPDHTSNGTRPSGPATRAGASTIGIAAATMVALTFAISTTGGAQRQPPTGQHPCGLAVDRGPNGVAASRSAAIDTALARLGEWITARQCASVITTAFVDAGSYTPRSTYNVPRPPVHRDCAGAAETTHVDTKHAGVAIFGGYTDRMQKQSRTRCAQDEAKADSAYAAAAAQFLRNIRTAVLQEQVAPPLASNIAGLLQSLFAVGIYDVLVVSTGIDGAGIPDRLPSDARVVFVTFEAKEGFLGRSATDAAADKWRRAGATVFTFPQLTPGTLTRVLKPPVVGI